MRLPDEITKRHFVLEVLSLFIPGWVEADQIEKIAQMLSDVGPEIPFTILAFFPEYQLKDVPSPNLEQMLEAYNRAKDKGLTQVRLGNIGIFARSKTEIELLRNLP